MKIIIFFSDSLRQNLRDQAGNEDAENLDKMMKNDEAEAFLKQFIQIGADTDLKTITDNIKKMDVDKDSLYELVLFFSELVSLAIADRYEKILKSNKTVI